MILTNEQIELAFLQSALIEENKFISTEDVLDWIKRRNEEVEVKVQRIKFSQFQQWTLNYCRGNIQHQSGKFFSIDGIQVNTNWGGTPEWQQPIINQPEIGYLGFIVKQFDGILYFLVQAKIEPGNINNVQLSPTLQATKSNYTQVHEGRKPKYLEYFQRCPRENILLDQLQSEQGARFLQKRNRNIIILVDDEIKPEDAFIWLTLGQIKKLSQIDNIVNMDTRTVISGIPFGIYNQSFFDLMNIFQRQSLLNFNSTEQYLLNSALNGSSSLFPQKKHIAWLTDLKCRFSLHVKKIPLQDLSEWEISDYEISRPDGRFFKIIATTVTISNREVNSWEQPLMQPAQEGIIAFVLKVINGVLHCLIQAKLECGNFDILELAPTVQCLTGSYKKHEQKIPYLEYILNSKKDQILFDSMQSEEGGRFYQEQNRNVIVMADDSFPIDTPDCYTWMTLYQLYEFIKYNNYLNIQARSLLSMISFI